MKKLLQIALICGGVGLIAAASSCSSTYDAYPDVPGRDTIKNTMRGDFTATIDGVHFAADVKTVVDTTIDGVRSITLSGNMFSWDKNPKSYQNLTLSIADFQGPNTYQIQLGVAGTYIVVEEGEPYARYAKNDGDEAYITITSAGDKLEGTFQFVVAPNGLGNDNNANITSGKFSVPK